MNEIDGLIPIYNKGAAEYYIDSILSGGDTPVIALADVDFFVNIDMKVGSAEGDSILKNIGLYLRDNVDGFVARYGGDEFLFVIPNKDISDAFLQMNELRKKFKRQRFISINSIYHAVPMTLSIGITQNGKTRDTLLKEAEISLAVAKKMGRNRVEQYKGSKIRALTDSGAFVQTIAGMRLRGYSGDGHLAATAQICEPYGVDVSPDGSIYFADRGNHAIRKIKDGTITTIAGDGKYGYSGDGDNSLRARLNKPSGVSCGSDGCIYIADTGNHCLRQIDKNGIIRTIAGNGKEGNGGKCGPSSIACLSRPGGVVVDNNNNVYTNDYGNNRILRISPDGYFQQIVGTGEYGRAGDGGVPLEAKLNKPYGLAVTADGYRLLIADYGNCCIREVDLRHNRIRTFLDFTTVVPHAGLYWACIMKKYVFIADGNNHCIWCCDDHSGRILGKIGDGAGYNDAYNINERSLWNIPAGIAADPSHCMLYVADYANNAIRKIVLREKDAYNDNNITVSINNIARPSDYPSRKNCL